MSINIDVSNLIGMTLDNVVFPTESNTTYTGYFTINNGLAISTIPYIQIDYGTFVEKATAIEEPDGRYKVTYKLPSLYTPEKVTAYGVALEKSNLLSQYRFIRAYKANENIISQIANTRFYTEQGGREDLGKYILSYIHYPFDVETSDSANIELGFYNTEINCELVKEQYHNFILFNGVVNGLYNNDSDIVNAEIIIFLPFVGKYNLDSK